MLPESLPPERRKAFQWKSANPVGAVRFLRANREALGLAGVHFLNSFAHISLPSVYVLYASYRFGWNERMVGLTMACSGVCMLVVQGGVVRPAVKRLGERRSLLLGLTAGAVGFAIYGLAPTGLVMACVGFPIMALWGLAGPSAQGLMSRRIHASEQGQLQGALASLVGIGGMVGPSVFSQVFAYAIEPQTGWHLPGAPFLLSTLMLGCAVGVAARVTRAPRTEEAVALELPPVA